MASKDPFSPSRGSRPSAFHACELRQRPSDRQSFSCTPRLPARLGRGTPRSSRNSSSGEDSRGVLGCNGVLHAFQRVWTSMPAGCVGRGEVRGCGLGGACTALGSHGEPWILLAVGLRGCKGALGRESWGSSRPRGKKRSVGGPRWRVHSAAAAVRSFSWGSRADRLPRGRGLRGSVRGAAHFSPRLSRPGAGEYPRGGGAPGAGSQSARTSGPCPAFHWPPRAKGRDLIQGAWPGAAWPTWGGGGA